MRRFEIAGEKFWQYELDGAEAVIEWGKVGGTGKQRQHKKFASPAHAQREMAKLVASKCAEGFAEPAPLEARAEAPVQAATPGPSVGDRSVGDRVVLTEEIKRTAEEQRGIRRPPPDGDERAWLAQVAAHYQQRAQGVPGTFAGLHRDRYRAGLDLPQTTPEARAWADRMLRTYAEGKDPPEPDPEGDAAVATDCDEIAFVSYLLARAGLPHVARVMLASVGIFASYHADSRYFMRDPAVHLVWMHGPSHLLASFVRGALEDAPLKVRTETVCVIEEAFPGVPPQLRIVCAHALGRADWAREEAERFLAGNTAGLSYDYPQQLFQVLRDPPLVTRLAKAHPQRVLHELLVADMGIDACEALGAAHAKEPNDPVATAALAAIESVPAARALAESLGKKRAGPAARDYFLRRPDLAVAVLEPLVKSSPKLAPFARPVLLAVVDAHPELRSAERPHATVASRVPDAFAQAIPLRRPVPLAAWTASLPQVLLRDGTALPRDAVETLLLALHESAPRVAHAALAPMKDACDTKSLAELGWSLFEAWLGSGGSSKENWAFTALGHLGDDECARRLAPLVRAWPGESQHARAVVGLDVLAAIGTDVALMHLHGIAQKIKFKALQEKARIKMDELAQARGLTADELADRLVPDLDLDEDGSLRLDFGPRAFTVGFDEELKPFVLDGASAAKGRRLADLPKPNKADDAEKAKEASERFKVLKKDARTIASNQILRLEIAMCSQRRWSAQDFRAFIVDHPLLVHLARRLVWGDAETTFRVAEDRSYVSADDKPVKPPPTVGLVHRLDVDPKSLAAWGDHLGRYELIQPFDQLSRELFRIDEREKHAHALDRTKGVKVKTGKVLGLEARGWRKGVAQDAGWVWDMQKTVGPFELTLPLGGGLCMGWHEGTPSEQELGALGIGRRKGTATFGELSPVVFSELVRELQMLQEG